MNRMPSVPRLFVQPYRLFAIVLGLVFSFELLVMLLLPQLSNWITSSLALATLDSFLLAVALVPFLWKLIVIPLKEVAELRLNLIDWSLARQEAQEKQIASNLHDGIGQMITGLTIGLRAVESMTHDEAIISKVAELRSLGRQIHQQLRQIARELRPPVLDDVGLMDAIRNLVDQVKLDFAVTATFQSDGLEQRRLPSTVETALYRITQEAITNAIRHGNPKAISVALKSDEELAELTVTDNGCGFDVAVAFEKSPKKQPFGLHSMLERASILGGKMDLSSTLGKGTTVHVQIPIRKDE